MQNGKKVIQTRIIRVIIISAIKNALLKLEFKQYGPKSGQNSPNLTLHVPVRFPRYTYTARLHASLHKKSCMLLYTRNHAWSCHPKALFKFGGDAHTLTTADVLQNRLGRHSHFYATSNYLQEKTCMYIRTCPKRLILGQAI